MTWLLGKTIKHYEIQEIIGKGGMGTVYLANDKRYNRPVAIKITRDSDNLERFKNELEILERLNNEYILSLEDYGDESSLGISFLVSPYYPNGTLQDLIDEKKLAVTDLLRILKQITTAVHHAHTHDVEIIHRDLKPSNILFNALNDVGVADFGIAKLTANDNTLTMEGRPLGSPLYMPYELWTNARTADRTTDIYSLAVITYQLMTHQLPFTGSTQEEIKEAHRYKTPSPIVISHNGESYPSKINGIIQKALSKLQSERQQTIQTYIENIETAVNEDAEQYGIAIDDLDYQIQEVSVFDTIAEQPLAPTVSIAQPKPSVSDAQPKSVDVTLDESASTQSSQDIASPITDSIKQSAISPARNGNRSLLIGGGVIIIVVVAFLVGSSLGGESNVLDATEQPTDTIVTTTVAPATDANTDVPTQQATNTSAPTQQVTNTLAPTPTQMVESVAIVASVPPDTIGTCTITRNNSGNRAYSGLYDVPGQGGSPNELFRATETVEVMSQRQLPDQSLWWLVDYPTNELWLLMVTTDGRQLSSFFDFTGNCSNIPSS